MQRLVLSPPLVCQADVAHLLIWHGVRTCVGEAQQAGWANARHGLSGDGARLSLFVLCATEKPPKCKRSIVQPREGFTIENVVAQTVTPIPYDIVKEGVQT